MILRIQFVVLFFGLGWVLAAPIGYEMYKPQVDGCDLLCLPSYYNKRAVPGTEEILSSLKLLFSKLAPSSSTLKAALLNLKNAESEDDILDRSVMLAWRAAAKGDPKAVDAMNGVLFYLRTIPEGGRMKGYWTNLLLGVIQDGKLKEGFTEKTALSEARKGWGLLWNAALDKVGWRNPSTSHILPQSHQDVVYPMFDTELVHLRN